MVVKCSDNLLGKNKFMEVVQSHCELSESYQCSASMIVHSSTVFFSLKSSGYPCRILPHGGYCEWRCCWSPHSPLEPWAPSPIPLTGPTGLHWLCMCENDWKQWFSSVHLRKKWTKIPSWLVLGFFFNKDGVKARSCKSIRYYPARNPQHLQTYHFFQLQGERVAS